MSCAAAQSCTAIRWSCSCRSGRSSAACGSPKRSGCATASAHSRIFRCCTASPSRTRRWRHGARASRRSSSRARRRMRRPRSASPDGCWPNGRRRSAAASRRCGNRAGASGKLVEGPKLGAELRNDPFVDAKLAADFAQARSGAMPAAFTQLAGGEGKPRKPSSEIFATGQCKNETGLPARTGRRSADLRSSGIAGWRGMFPHGNFIRVQPVENLLKVGGNPARTFTDRLQMR